MTRAAATFFDQVGPELYRQNPFRVTGLSVDADARDIRRRAERLRIEAKLGTAAAGGRSPLALDPPPDADAIQEAIRRLRDPVRRLEAELFWFWPSHHAASGVRDEALEALRTGDVARAEELWSHPAPGRATAVAAHNLAVLAHARALDSGDLSHGSHPLWLAALRHWRSVLDDGAFWDLVAARVRAADDPRLGAHAATELRTSLPSALLSISARLAVRAALDGAHVDARRHVTLLRDVGFATDAVDTAVRDAVNAEVTQLRSRAQTALDRTEASSADGYDEADRLLDLAEPILDGLGAVLPEDHPLLVGIRDEVAEQVRRCVVRYLNETKAWSDADDILRDAESLAASAPVKARITRDLEIVRDNGVYDTCWFCQLHAPDENATFEQPMYGDVDQEFIGYQIRVTWRKGTIRVPRCVSCQQAHANRTRRAWSLGCGGSLAVLLFAIWLLVEDFVAAGLLVAGVAVVNWFVALSTSNRNGLTGREHARLRDFPPIREQLAAGWQFGDRPESPNG